MTIFQIEDIKIIAVVDDLLEDKIVVRYVYIDGNGGEFGDQQEVVFWGDNMPMNVYEDGTKERPDIPNWLDISSKHQKQMKTRSNEIKKIIKKALLES